MGRTIAYLLSFTAYFRVDRNLITHIFDSRAVKKEKPTKCAHENAKIATLLPPAFLHAHNVLYESPSDGVSNIGLWHLNSLSKSQ